jgi:MOSC domain-containing protein YiiM
VSVNTGLLTLLGVVGGREVHSAFIKTRVAAPFAEVRELGLAGDHQVDRRVTRSRQVHGGPDKAIYVYPGHHRAQWSIELRDRLFVPGDFGENLTVLDVDESLVRIGEIWTINGVVMRVTGPRRPCYKLDLVHGPGTAAAMMQNGRCGWYMRVMRGGTIPTKPSRIGVTHRPLNAPTVLQAFRAKTCQDPTIPGPPEPAV